MSRHELEQRDKTVANGQLDIVIGWDRPLNTFFVQVLDPARDEEDVGHEILWRGASFGEILSPDDAIALVMPWAEIPSDLHDILVADRNRET